MIESSNPASRQRVRRAIVASRGLGERHGPFRSLAGRFGRKTSDFATRVDSRVWTLARWMGLVGSRNSLSATSKYLGRVFARMESGPTTSEFAILTFSHLFPHSLPSPLPKSIALFCYREPDLPSRHLIHRVHILHLPITHGPCHHRAIDSGSREGRRRGGSRHLFFAIPETALVSAMSPTVLNRCCVRLSIE